MPSSTVLQIVSQHNVSVFVFVLNESSALELLVMVRQDAGERAR